MKSKTCALVAISVLIVFMAWPCFTWPVVEVRDGWTDESHMEADVASWTVKRPPTPAEVVFRVVTCAASLLLGIALMRVLRSKKAR
jgi:hypothetical protein